MPGLTVRGFLYELRTPGLPTAASGGSVSDGDDEEAWPTPMAHDTSPGNPERVGRFGTAHGGRNLNDEAALWATPQARDFRSPDQPDGPRQARKADLGYSSNLNEQVAPAGSDHLNPAWVEILMGWPIGWTDAANPCPGIWPGWPAGMGPHQHAYEPPRIATKGTVPNRVARIKACGNGVVPQQAEAAFFTLLSFGAQP